MFTTLKTEKKMISKEVWLHKEELNRILKVLDDHPEFNNNFKLIYRSCGIGKLVDIEFRYKNIFEQVNITNESEW